MAMRFGEMPPMYVPPRPTGIEPRNPYEIDGPDDEEERICAREGCTELLTGRTARARYCSAKCRMAAFYDRHPDRRYRPVQNAQRRPSRDGRGVHIYLTPAELADLVARYGAEPGPDSMMRKLARAARVTDERR